MYIYFFCTVTIVVDQVGTLCTGFITVLVTCHLLINYSATGTTFDIDIPFSYELPDSATSVFTARKIEDEHAAILEMAEDLLNKYYICLQTNNLFIFALFFFLQVRY